MRSTKILPVLFEYVCMYVRHHRDRGPYGKSFVFPLLNWPRSLATPRQSKPTLVLLARTLTSLDSSGSFPPDHIWGQVPWTHCVCLELVTMAPEPHCVCFMFEEASFTLRCWWSVEDFGPPGGFRTERGKSLWSSTK